MKNFSEFNTEIEQVIQKSDKEMKMEYFKDLSEGNTDPYIDPCIYKSIFEEGIQRRKKSQTEYISRVSRLYQDLKQTEGDNKIDVIGKILEVIIQHQLFGMK